MDNRQTAKALIRSHSRIQANFCLLIAILSTLSICLAAAPTYAVETNLAKEDISFYDRVTFPDGPFQGQLVDTKNLRSVVFVSDTQIEKFYGKKVGTILVSNFFHNGELYLARIPVHGVTQASLVFDYFTKKNTTAHVMALYQFSSDNPIELIARVNEPTKLISIPLFELLFSVEATGRKGDEFDMKRGLQDNFLASYRFISLESRMRDTINDDRGQFEVLDIQMTPEERQNSLMNSIFVAQIHGMNTMYNTLSNNCVTNALYVLGIDPSHNSNLMMDAAKSIPSFIKWFLGNPSANNIVTESRILNRSDFIQ